MAKYQSKLRRHPKADTYDHIGSDGKPKKRLRPQHAKAIAERTGMNAYHCTYCGSWHVGRNPTQRAEDGWKKGRKK